MSRLLHRFAELRFPPAVCTNWACICRLYRTYLESSHLTAISDTVGNFSTLCSGPTWGELHALPRAAQRCTFPPPPASAAASCIACWRRGQAPVGSWEPSAGTTLLAALSPSTDPPRPPHDLRVRAPGAEPTAGECCVGMSTLIEAVTAFSDLAQLTAVQLWQDPTTVFAFMKQALNSTQFGSRNGERSRCTPGRRWLDAPAYRCTVPRGQALWASFHFHALTHQLLLSAVAGATCRCLALPDSDADARLPPAAPPCHRLLDVHEHAVASWRHYVRGAHSTHCSALHPFLSRPSPTHPIHSSRSKIRRPADTIQGPPAAASGGPRARPL